MTVDREYSVVHIIYLDTHGYNRALGNNDRQDFRIISGILRLSTKYIIDSLRSKALDHLSIAWPATLQGWDAREDASRAYELETGVPRGHMYPSPIVRPPHASL